MLKVWLGKDGGSVIISKSDPQHHFMEKLGFKSIVGIKYGSDNCLDPGDFCIYRAADYLGNDSIYRCMRINDGTDQRYLELKKERQNKSKFRQDNKIFITPGDICTISDNDIQYWACNACKRIFRPGNYNKHIYSSAWYDQEKNQDIDWSYKTFICCDKYYVVGENPNIPGHRIAFLTQDGSRVVRSRWHGKDQMSDAEHLIVDYITGRKEAKKIGHAK